MTRLAAHDLAALASFGRDLAQRADGDLGSPAALDALLELVRADVIEWGASDERRRQLIELRHYPPLLVLRATDPAVVSGNAAFWDAWPACPVCGPSRLRTSGAVKLSEISDTSRAHPQHFQCPGVTIGHQLNLFIRPADIVPRHVIFTRESGIDFDERDRLVLELAGTFLAQQTRNFDVRRDLAAALAAFDAHHAEGAHALMLLEARHRPGVASPNAAMLLNKYFGWNSATRRLPRLLERWLEEGDLFEAMGGRDRASLPPLRRLLALTELIIRSANVEGRVALVLEEKQYDFPGASKPLTRRELEILEAVAEGFTNGQIAARLSISPATVGKHLENAFVKLGVRSRAAAVALLSGTSTGRERAPFH